MPAKVIPAIQSHGEVLVISGIVTFPSFPYALTTG